MLIRLSATCLAITLVTMEVSAQVNEAVSANAEAAGISCIAQGYDIILSNNSDQIWSLGTVINWSVPFIRLNSSNTLSRNIKPGDTAIFSAVLGSSFLNKQIPCTAVFAKQ